MSDQQRIESQLLHMQQARALIVRNHKRTLRELDDWIKNIERDLDKHIAIYKGHGK